MEIVSAPLEAYARAHSTAEDSLLEELARVTYARTSRPQMQTGHVAGLFLRQLVRLMRAERVLEIGTFTGYSALSMAMGMGESGRIVTCDVDEETTTIAQSFWERSEHGGKIELRLGPALDTVASLNGPFDLVFIDADKPAYKDYWEATVPMLRAGGAIVVDNTLWSGRVIDPQDQDDHTMVAFNKHVVADARMESVLLTVRDGMTLAWKKG